MYEKFLNFFVSIDTFFGDIAEKVSGFWTTYMDPLFETWSFTLFFCVSLALLIMIPLILITYWYENSSEKFENSCAVALKNLANNNEEDEEKINETN